MRRRAEYRHCARTWRSHWEYAGTRTARRVCGCRCRRRTSRGRGRSMSEVWSSELGCFRHRLETGETSTGDHLTFAFIARTTPRPTNVAVMHRVTLRKTYAAARTYSPPTIKPDVS